MDPFAPDRFRRIPVRHPNRQLFDNEFRRGAGVVDYQRILSGSPENIHELQRLTFKVRVVSEPAIVSESRYVGDLWRSAVLMLGLVRTRGVHATEGSSCADQRQDKSVRCYSI